MENSEGKSLLAETEKEASDLYDQVVVLQSMLAEYRTALSDAQVKVAMLNGQARVKDMRIQQLLAGEESPEPTV